MTNAEIMDRVNIRLDVLDSDEVLSSNLRSESATQSSSILESRP